MNLLLRTRPGRWAGLVRDRRRGIATRRGRIPRVESLESRQLLTSTTIADFGTPTASAGPGWIAAGSDGNLWFTEFNVNKVGTINPTTHATSDFSLPTASASPEEIAAGPDGNLWFTELTANKIGMINPTTHAITEFAIPTASAGPYGITTGPDGNVWFTENLADKIGMINPTTHVVTEFTLPTAGAEPLGITTGPDGNLWFTEYAGDKIGMINPTTHAITEFAVPTAGSDPFSIATGPDGNLWFTEFTGNKIGVINPTTHAITEINSPTATSSPVGIAAGPDGNLWFTENTANQIGTINPVTHGISEFASPTASSSPLGIAAGSDGNLWYAEINASKIGAVSPATYLSFTAQPPAFVQPGNSFGTTVSVDYLSGLVDTGYNGPVTIALVNPGTATLGGTLTATAKNGAATFTGLSINQLGTGYRLMAYTDPLTTTTSTPVTVDVAPTIVSATVVYAGKGARKHAVGFVITFSKPLSATSAQALGNYTVTQTVKVRGKSLAKAVALTSAVYNATSDSVTLTMAGKPGFATGGMILVNGTPPDGITDTLGAFLDGTDTGVFGTNGTLIITPKARKIKLTT
jgi:streptogramin lyase